MEEGRRLVHATGEMFLVIVETPCGLERQGKDL